jgi:hypothetical protein
MARLQAIAAKHSMRIEINKRFRTLNAIRTGPGHPPRFTTRASRDTPGGWNTAARRLHDAIAAEATPDGL